VANPLKTAMVNAILILEQRGWSQRPIARVLGTDREPYNVEIDHSNT